MTTTPKALFRGAASTGSTTLYTVPGSTTAIVTDIVITNTSTAATATLKLDGIDLCTAISIPANGFVSIGLKQVLATGKIVAGLASATTVNFHISGVEIA